MCLVNEKYKKKLEIRINSPRFTVLVETNRLLLTAMRYDAWFPNSIFITNVFGKNSRKKVQICGRENFRTYIS